MTRDILANPFVQGNCRFRHPVSKKIYSGLVNDGKVLSSSLPFPRYSRHSRERVLLDSLANFFEIVKSHSMTKNSAIRKFHVMMTIKQYQKFRTEHSSEDNAVRTQWLRQCASWILMTGTSVAKIPCQSRHCPRWYLHRRLTWQCIECSTLIHTVSESWLA